MKTKIFLNSISRLDLLINIRLEELEKTKERITSCSSSLSERVQTSGNNDKVLDAIISLEKLENEIKRLIDEQINAKVKALEIFKYIKRDLYIYILHKRYFYNETLEKIAYDTNYSYAYIRKAHGWALQEFEKAFEKLEQKGTTKSGIM